MLKCARLFLLFVLWAVGATPCPAAPAGGRFSAPPPAPPPLRVTVRVERPVVFLGEPLVLHVAVTNVSNRPALAPNVALRSPFARPGAAKASDASTLFIDAGILIPRVTDVAGRDVGRAIVACPPPFPEGTPFTVTLRPGQTIRARADIGHRWGFYDGDGPYARRTGDFAITAGHLMPSHHGSKEMQGRFTSNTCLVRVLPARRARRRLEERTQP